MNKKQSDQLYGIDLAKRIKKKLKEIEVAVAPGVAFVGVAMEDLKMGAECQCILKSDGTFEIRECK